MKKNPTSLKAPQSVIDKARAILEKFNRNTWPEDDWFSVNKYWDLNVYQFNRKNWATLYRVYGGQTDTSRWHPLYESDFVCAEQSILQRALDDDQREQLAQAAVNTPPEVYEQEFERIQNLIDFKDWQM